MEKQQTFQFADSSSTLTSPLQLHIKEIPFTLFEALNKEWHSRLPEVGAFYIDALFFGGFYEDVCYAVAGWSKPIAIYFNGKPYYELRRFAISPESPKNTASRMMRIMEKIIRGIKPNIEHLISYQDTAVHSGTIYKASGWKQTRVSKAEEQNWVNTHPRKAHELQTTSSKIRWQKDLK